MGVEAAQEQPVNGLYLLRPGETEPQRPARTGTAITVDPAYDGLEELRPRLSPQRPELMLEPVITLPKLHGGPPFRAFDLLFLLPARDGKPLRTDYGREEGDELRAARVQAKRLPERSALFGAVGGADEVEPEDPICRVLRERTMQAP